MNLAITPSLKIRFYYPGGSVPLVGGLVYTVAPGTTATFGVTPTYPITTYADSTGLALNTNPIVLNANGEADCWLSTFTKFVVFDPLGNLVMSVDNVSAMAFGAMSQFQQVPGVPVYVSATSFKIIGSYASSFPKGTALKAILANGTICYGYVVQALVAGNPAYTTVSVQGWKTGALDATVASVWTSLITPMGVVTPSSAIYSALPLPTPQDSILATCVLTLAGLNQNYFINNTGGNITITLPSLSGVAVGEWVRFRNINVSGNYSVQIVGTIDGIVNPYMLGVDWEIISDGTAWHARVGPAVNVGIAFSLSNVLNNGALTSGWQSLLTAIQGINVPACARAVFGFMWSSDVGNPMYLANAATVGGALNTGYYVAASSPNSLLQVFRIPLVTPQTLFRSNAANGAYVTITGYEI